MSRRHHPFLMIPVFFSALTGYSSPLKTDGYHVTIQALLVPGIWPSPNKTKTKSWWLYTDTRFMFSHPFSLNWNSPLVTTVRKRGSWERRRRQIKGSLVSVLHCTSVTRRAACMFQPVRDVHRCECLHMTRQPGLERVRSGCLQS